MSVLNYFEFYQIPVSLFPNLATLKAKYYSYARKFHPDHNQEEDTETMAAVNNEAYQCLTNLDDRLEHVLKISGIEISDNTNISGMFLMEVMEIQESIMEVDEASTEAIDTIKNQIDGLAQELDEELKVAETNLDLESEDWKNNLLENLKKRRYLRRMRDNLMQKI